MGSIPVFTKDPYAPGTLDRAAAQVDRLIGSAYEVVREVAENLEYIKHVSSHLVQIYRVYQSVDGLDQIAIHLPELLVIYENLQAILEHGASAVTVSDTAPLPPLLQGHLWWNSVNGNLYTWYNDVNSSQWVEIGGGGGGSSARIIISDNAPTVEVLAGQLWWSSVTGSLYIWYEDSDSGQWVQINTNTGIANLNTTLIDTPEDFGAKGDGTTVDDTALTAWANSCNAAGITATTRAGAKYRCSATLALTLTVPFKAAPGSEFLVPNNGQNNPLFNFDSVPADIEILTVASINTWVNAYKGSRKIPQLIERDWVYHYHTTDAIFLKRGLIVGDFYLGETFCTVNNDGQLDSPLVNTIPLPLTGVSANRRKLRYQLEVNGLIVRIITGTSNTMNRCIITQRPNTVFRNCHVFNDSGQNCQQGFVVTGTMFVKYENCSTSGLMVVSTEYGFNSGYGSSITYENCSESQCRRGIDANGKNCRVYGGSFPDGVGGHWIDGLYIHGAVIGLGNTINPRCIMVSGANVMATDCQFHVGQNGNVLRRREDFPELSGFCIIRGGSIIIDDTDDTTINVSEITLMQLSVFAAYDSLRAVTQPNYVEFTPDLIKQIGATSTTRILLVSHGAPYTAAQFPQNIICNGRMLINPGHIDLEGGPMVVGGPRLAVVMWRAETQIGTRMDVEVRNIRTLQVLCGPVSTAVAGSAGRYDIFVYDAVTSTCQFNLRFGAVRRARLIRCNSTALLDRGVLTESIGDEAIDFEDYGADDQGLLVNPFSIVQQRGNGITIADGTHGADGWVGLAETGDLFFSTALNLGDILPGMGQWLQPDLAAKRVGCVTFLSNAATLARQSRLVNLIASLRSSVPMSIRYAIGEWTGAPNFPTRDVVNNWASTSYTPGGFFIAATTNVLSTGVMSVTNTTTPAALPAHIGADAQHLWVMFWTEGTIVQNAWFRVAADLYTGFERPLLRRRSNTDEKMRCFERYRSIPMTVSTTSKYVSLSPPTTKVPTITATVGTISNATVDGFDIVHSGTAASVITISADI